MENQVLNVTAFEVNNNTPGKTCLNYFNPENQALNAESDLSACVEMTKKFRELDASNKLQTHFFTSGYILPLDDIRKLLNQDVKSINGIKIYFGIDVDQNSKLTTNLIAVGTYKEDDKHLYSDFNIPKTVDEIAVSTAVLKVPKPCPKQCGTSNVLNPDPENIS